MRGAKQKTRRENEKSKKKSIAKKLKEQKVGFVIFASMFVITLVMSLTLLDNIDKNRSKDEQLAARGAEYNRLRIKNDAMQEDINAPFDDEYIMEIARRYGYRTYEEIMYYIPSGD